MRISFLIVLACHIPFVFFFGKDSALKMYVEIKNKSISNFMEGKGMTQRRSMGSFYNELNSLHS